MTTPRLWAWLAVALPVLAAIVAPMSTVDLAYHLRAGDEMLDARALPTVDTWTFTVAGARWVDQQWGAQLVLWAIHALADWTGLVVLRALVVGAVFATVLAAARARGLETRRAALLTIAAFVVAAPALGLRPQLFGILAFALTVFLVWRRETQPRAAWLIPVVALVWANLHGSFILAPAVVGVALVGDLLEGRRDRAIGLAAVLGATLLATFVTPFGPGVWVYAVTLSRDPEIAARVTEWQPTTIDDASGLLFFASAAAVILVLARRGRVTGWRDLLWLAVFGALALLAQRGIVWWAIAVVPIVAGWLSAATSESTAPAPDTPTLRRVNLGVAAALTVAMVALLPGWRPTDPDIGAPSGLLRPAPGALTAGLRDVAEPGAHVLHPQPLGSWLEFAVPTALVTVDARIELFPSEVWDAYEAVAAGREGWPAILDAWAVDLVVVDPADRAFHDRLAAAGWMEAYAGEDGWILARP
jgi:hypothetical protein